MVLTAATTQAVLLKKNKKQAETHSKNSCRRSVRRKYISIYAGCSYLWVKSYQKHRGNYAFKKMTDLIDL